MARFALVRPNDVVDRLAGDVDPTVQTKNGWRWLSCPAVAKPAFDADTQTVDGPAYSVGASTVAELWTVRSLTAQEISDLKDARIAAMNGANIALRVVHGIHNRVRTLEGQATHTLAQFRALIKAALPG